MSYLQFSISVFLNT